MRLQLCEMPRLQGEMKPQRESLQCRQSETQPWQQHGRRGRHKSPQCVQNEITPPNNSLRCVQSAIKLQHE